MWGAKEPQLDNHPSGAKWLRQGKKGWKCKQVRYDLNSSKPNKC